MNAGIKSRIDIIVKRRLIGANLLIMCHTGKGEATLRIARCASLVIERSASCAIVILFYCLDSSLQYSAGAYVATAVVGLGVLALGDTAAASRVDEVEGVVVVDTGDNAHVSHPTAA